MRLMKAGSGCMIVATINIHHIIIHFLRNDNDLLKTLNSTLKLPLLKSFSSSSWIISSNELMVYDWNSGVDNTRNLQHFT